MFTATVEATPWLVVFLYPGARRLQASHQASRHLRQESGATKRVPDTGAFLRAGFIGGGSEAQHGTAVTHPIHGLIGKEFEPIHAPVSSRALRWQAGWWRLEDASELEASPRPHPQRDDHEHGHSNGEAVPDKTAQRVATQET